jgi:hypothetical protein
METPEPTNTPFDPAATVANAALSNYYMAIGILIAAIVVIVIALGFALLYHRRALEVIAVAVARGQGVSTESDEVAKGLSTDARIKGPKTGMPNEELLFGLAGVESDKTVNWRADKATPSSQGGATFTTTFEKAGEYTIEATVEGLPDAVKHSITIGAATTAAAPTPVVIPFVLKNWGRLVIVLFGVGVIAALMSTRIVSAEAGIGILGALLGAGATAVATGAAPGDGGSATQPPASAAPSSGGTTPAGPRGDGDATVTGAQVDQK